MVGGGYLTDLFEFEFYILPVEVARLCGVKVSNSALGIGPFSDPWNANKFQKALQGTRVLTRRRGFPDHLSEFGHCSRRSKG